MRKPFLDIHIRNVMSKFEISRLNGVAVIAKTNIHTYIHAHIVQKMKGLTCELSFLRRLVTASGRQTKLNPVILASLFSAVTSLIRVARVN